MKRKRVHTHERRLFDRVQQAEDYLKNGFLNGLFVLGRSIGFIGHFLDQARLQEGLYRHPTDDIFYMTTSGPDQSVVPL
jgi:hypothetical protein